MTVIKCSDDMCPHNDNDICVREVIDLYTATKAKGTIENDYEDSITTFKCSQQEKINRCY